MNRTSLVLIGIVLLAAGMPVASAADGDSAHVLAVERIPTTPAAGQTVTVALSTQPNVSSVRAIYCRVQLYACAPAVNLTRINATAWLLTIPWTDRFFAHVKEVGYKFELTLHNGTNESSPTHDVPARPIDLPQGADTYYFYSIQRPTPSPAPTPLAALVLLFAAGRFRRRRA